MRISASKGNIFFSFSGGNYLAKFTKHGADEKIARARGFHPNSVKATDFERPSFRLDRIRTRPRFSKTDKVWAIMVLGN